MLMVVVDDGSVVIVLSCGHLGYRIVDNNDDVVIQTKCGPCVRCPGHGAIISLRDGISVDDDYRFRQRMYGTAIDSNGMVWINVRGKDPTTLGEEEDRYDQGQRHQEEDRQQQQRVACPTKDIEDIIDHRRSTFTPPDRRDSRVHSVATDTPVVMMMTMQLLDRQPASSCGVYRLKMKMVSSDAAVLHDLIIDRGPLITLLIQVDDADTIHLREYTPIKLVYDNTGIIFHLLIRCYTNGKVSNYLCTALPVGEDTIQQQQGKLVPNNIFNWTKDYQGVMKNLSFICAGTGVCPALQFLYYYSSDAGDGRPCCGGDGGLERITLIL
ncbi:hypothetical protein FOZ63_004419 [Perkinsus olseni]|uniref:Rieske domain-containing protein n=1 Tax=Perkinsus olseni TaxID=32597 RepID=A0A7J6RUS5_PEROL|nr:hypothetical protein FOZ63_004419 [Perkinsus olseni]